MAEMTHQQRSRQQAGDKANASQRSSGRVMEDNRPGSQLIKQLKPNKTGLPDSLKAGMESLSGLSLDHVRVHRNSSKPATVQAHAFAQGADIHLASGQEHHLPHELGHVVQQAQGRVQATTSVGGMAVNDNAGLEREADFMGGKALQMQSKFGSVPVGRNDAVRFESALNPSKTQQNSNMKQELGFVNDRPESRAQEAEQKHTSSHLASLPIGKTENTTLIQRKIRIEDKDKTKEYSFTDTFNLDGNPLLSSRETDNPDDTTFLKFNIKSTFDIKNFTHLTQEQALRGESIENENDRLKLMKNIGRGRTTLFRNKNDDTDVYRAQPFRSYQSKRDTPFEISIHKTRKNGVDLPDAIGDKYDNLDKVLEEALNSLTTVLKEVKNYSRISPQSKNAAPKRKREIKDSARIKDRIVKGKEAFIAEVESWRRDIKAVWIAEDHRTRGAWKHGLAHMKILNMYLTALKKDITSEVIEKLAGAICNEGKKLGSGAPWAGSGGKANYRGNAEDNNTIPLLNRRNSMVDDYQNGGVFWRPEKEGLNKIVDDFAEMREKKRKSLPLNKRQKK